MVIFLSEMTLLNGEKSRRRQCEFFVYGNSFETCSIFTNFRYNEPFHTIP